MSSSASVDIISDQAFADELAIRALVDRYSDAVNRRDFDTYRACWATDGVWNLGEPNNVRKEGVDNIVEEVKRTLGSFDFFAQMPHAGVVEVDGNRATATWTLNEIGRAADGKSGMFILAIYSDELVRQNGKWLFAKRTYRVLYLDDSAPKGRAFPIHM